jgi:N-acetylated-alpha-linked acidic dipeptidase
MLELVRILGSLYQEKKWQPRRTVILASWDGEEYGLLGSTEWVEDHTSFLSEKAVTYINVDGGAVGPYLHVKSTPSLNQFVRDIAQDVEWPEIDASWLQYYAKDKSPIPVADNPILTIPGSGSDFVSFYTHLGIPVLSLQMADKDKKSSNGVYHSNYDSAHWFEKFGDPHYTQSKAFTAYWGKLAAGH